MQEKTGKPVSAFPSAKLGLPPRATGSLNIYNQLRSEGDAGIYARALWIICVQ